jgi:hypothetical protein
MGIGGRIPPLLELRAPFNVTGKMLPTPSVSHHCEGLQSPPAPLGGFGSLAGCSWFSIPFTF